MYGHWFRILIMVGSIFLNICGMSSEKSDKKKVVNDWLELAYDCFFKKNTFLHRLPNEVHTDIFSRITPQSILDDWQCNNAICIHDVTIPYEVFNFHVSDNIVSYLTPRANVYETGYMPCWIDISTGKNHQLCEKGNGKGLCYIAQCGKDIVVYGKDENVLFTMNMNGDGKDIRWISSDVAFFTFHNTLPLCAIVEKNNLYKLIIYNGEGRYKSSLASNDYGPIAKLKCHPFKEIYAVQLQTTDVSNEIDRWWIVKKKSDTTIEESRAISGIQNCFFSIEQECMYVVEDHCLQSTKTIVVSSLNKIQQVKTIGTFDKSADLCAVGHSMFLTKKTVRKSSKQEFELRSFDGTKKIPLTVFNNTTCLHRLPEVHDNRYIVIEAQKNQYNEKISSKISVYVPRLQGCFEHYCMFKAALEIQEYDDKSLWDCFKHIKYKNLIAETVERYALFKKLMIIHDIVKGDAGIVL